MSDDAELRRLLSGPGPGEVPGGIGTVSLRANCPGAAQNVLERSREVLARVLHASAHDRLPSEEWQRILPSWFVAACAPERKPEEADHHIAWRRSLSSEEQAQVAEEEPWTLGGWIYWFESREREWSWWEAVVEDATTLRVDVEVPGWPTALGALEWLLRAAGATRVTIESDKGADAAG